MQEEILTLQFGSFSNQVLEKWWNLEQYCAENQIKVNIDWVSNSIFRKGNPTLPRLLIFDVKDNLSKYKYYQQFNQNVTQQQQMMGIWDQEKTQVIHTQEESKGEQVITDNYKGYSRFELTHRNFVKIPPVENFFNLYVTGCSITDKVDVADSIEDSIRFYLEESDQLRAFQIFLDVHSGYGPLNKFVLEFLEDECPKRPIMQYNMENPTDNTQEDNKTHQDMKNLNRIFSLQQLIEGTSYLMPTDPAQFKNYSHFEPKYKQTHKDAYLDIFALAISNITLPYRETHIKDVENTARKFVDILASDRSRNLVNACFHINQFPQVVNNFEQDLKKDFTENIFNFKSYKPICFFDISSKLPLYKSQMFGEDLTIRGDLAGIKRPLQYDETRYNYRYLERGLFVEPHYSNVLSEDIVKAHGTEKEDKSFVVGELDLSSAVFNSSIFTEYIKGFIDQFKNAHKQAKLQFVKDGHFKEDDMNEVLNQLYEKYDAYDQNDQGDGDSESD